MNNQPIKDKVLSALFFIKDKLRVFLPKVKSFVSKNVILLVAILAAVISCFFTPPSEKYLDYINFRTLCTLLSLLLVTRAMRSVKMFQVMAIKILTKVKTTRALSFIMVLLPTVFALLITNDIAVLTFVPFSIVMLKIANQNELAPRIITLQIIGANLSGMVSPLGNAQNLLLFEWLGVDSSWFLVNLYPVAIIGYFTLFLATIIGKNKKIEPISEAKRKIPVHKYIIYTLLFIVCILSVLKVIDIYYTTIAVVLVVLLLDHKVFKKTNYSIIFLFTAFFIFVGNLSSIPEINAIIQNAVNGNEYYVTVGLSQLISNTPETLLVYKFATNPVALACGVNVGKFGTFIASMSCFMAYSLFSSSTQNRLLVKRLMKNLLLFNLLFFVVTFLSGFIVIYLI